MLLFPPVIAQSSVCEIDPELKKLLRKFRFRKETTNGAIISK